MEYHKCLITAWKVYEVVTKLTKVEKDDGGTITMLSWNQTFSGLVFVKKNIPALKYDRDREIETVHAFI